MTLLCRHLCLSFSVIPVSFILSCPIIRLFLSLTLNCSFPFLYLCLSSSHPFSPFPLPYFMILVVFSLLYCTFPCLPVVLCCPSAGSSSAASGADTMRRSITGPIWGSSPRRRRSRQQNYKKVILACSPLLLSLHVVKTSPILALRYALCCDWCRSIEHELSAHFDQLLLQ